MRNKHNSSSGFTDDIESFLFSKYHDEITKMKYKEHDFKTLIIDFNELSEASSEFADKLIESPEQSIELLESKANSLTDIKGKPIKIKINNLLEKITLDKVLADEIGKLIETEGIIRRVRMAKARYVKSVFECRKCLRLHETEGNLTPSLCGECGNTEFKLKPEKCTFGDEQEILLEPFGSSTNRHGKKVILYDELVNSLEAGQRIQLTGIVKTDEPDDYGTFPLFMEANHIESNDKMVDFETSKEEIDEIKELSKREDIIELLANSLAPDISGNLNIKKTILYAIVGGSKHPTIRDKIHVLVISDPSMGKTQIGKGASEVSKIRYVSGTSSTGVGLTAGVVKDKDEWTLEAGALVLSNGHTVIIDEFDKLSVKEQKELLTPMESGIIPINKAGINTELIANTGIIALANPKEGRFDSYKSLKDQVKIYPPLATRFDLIVLMEDKPDESNDYEIAKTILNQYIEGFEHEDEIINKDLLKKYIHYAKSNYNPTISDELRERATEDYVNSRVNVDSYATRNLQAIIRLTQAIAKLKLKDKCDESDYEEAYEIFYEEYIKKFGSIDESGSYDMGKVTNDDSKSKERRNKVLNLMKDYLSENLYDSIKKSELVKLCETEIGWKSSYSYKIINELVENDVIVQNERKLSLPK